MIKKKKIGQAKAPYWYARAQTAENDPYCKGCRYYRELSMPHAQKACHYILDMGRSRPCPSGKDCTEKMPAAKRTTRKTVEE